MLVQLQVSWPEFSAVLLVVDEGGQVRRQTRDVREEGEEAALVEAELVVGQVQVLEFVEAVFGLGEGARGLAQLVEVDGRGELDERGLVVGVEVADEVGAEVEVGKLG